MGNIVAFLEMLAFLIGGGVSVTLGYYEINYEMKVAGILAMIPGFVMTAGFVVLWLS